MILIGISVLVLMVVGTTAMIYSVRTIVLDTDKDVNSYSSYIASAMSAFQIAVFNIIYSYAASRLTDMENHRTDSEYEDGMIMKLFLFQFVNSYSSFFYIAFIASYLPKPSKAEANWVGQVV